MKWIAYLFIAALTGCTVTPADIEQKGERQEFTSSRQPRAVADCMARNADSVRPTVAARIRDGEQPGVMELVAQISMGTGALARITPAGSGSRIEVWLSPVLVMGEREMGRKLAEGC